MVFLRIGLVGGFLVPLISLCQFDIKYLVAYSSVAHIGLVISGVLTMRFSRIMSSSIASECHQKSLENCVPS